MPAATTLRVRARGYFLYQDAVDPLPRRPAGILPQLAEPPAQWSGLSYEAPFRSRMEARYAGRTRMGRC